MSDPVTPEEFVQILTEQAEVAGVSVDEAARRLDRAVRIAKAFHETYERLAPTFDYRTREESAVPWAEVPPANRALMVSVVGNLLAKGVIHE